MSSFALMLQHIYEAQNYLGPKVAFLRQLEAVKLKLQEPSPLPCAARFHVLNWQKIPHFAALVLLSDLSASQV